jgi:hypothetical protein
MQGGGEGGWGRGESALGVDTIMPAGICKLQG